MQVQLTIPELQILADIIERQRYALTHAEESEQMSASDKKRMHELEEIYTKLVEKDLHFSADELDTISEFLHQRDEELRRQGPSQVEARRALESVMDRIVEACAMV